MISISLCLIFYSLNVSHRVIYCTLKRTRASIRVNYHTFESLPRQSALICDLVNLWRAKYMPAYISCNKVYLIDPTLSVSIGIQPETSNTRVISGSVNTPLYGLNSVPLITQILCSLFINKNKISSKFQLIYKSLTV